MNGSLNIYLILSVICAFVAVFAAALNILKHVKRDEINVEKRKKQIFRDKVVTKEEESNEKKQSSILQRLKELGITQTLGNELLEAEIAVRPEEFLAIWLLVALCVPLLFMLLFRNVILGIFLLIICFVGPLFYIKMRKGKKMETFDDQLSDALLTISNCLTAGLSFQQAIENIAREMDDPIASEFGRVVKDMRFGKTLEKSLTDMMERIPSRDLMIALNAILIQHQVGGNLSEMLESIAATIEDRHSVKKEIKVLTTQGKMSGLIIGALPIFLGIIITIMNPSYMLPFFKSQIGVIALIIGVLLEVVGMLVIKKIVTIEY